MTMLQGGVHGDLPRSNLRLRVPHGPLRAGVPLQVLAVAFMIVTAWIHIYCSSEAQLEASMVAGYGIRYAKEATDHEWLAGVAGIWFWCMPFVIALGSAFNRLDSHLLQHGGRE